MDALRVLMVTRRYWPHMSFDAAGRLASLAEGLRRLGIRPEVVAPRYAASWPAELEHRETPLHRPAPAPRGEWSMVRYSRNLSHWLREQANGCDVLYADAMREEGAMVVDAARRAGIASIVRFGGYGSSNDALWWEATRSGRRCRNLCLAADAIVAPRASSEQALLAAGADASRVHRIDDGFAAAPPGDAVARQAARVALADINSDLFVPPDGCVVLSTNRLDPQGGVMQLAESLPPLVRRTPGLRVWMTGDGPSRLDLYGFLQQEGIHRSVLLPGTFDQPEELLLAADLYVLPSAQDGLEFFLPAAIAAGVPVVVPESAEIRRLLGDAIVDATVFDPQQAGGIQRALQSALGDLPKLRQAGMRLRQAILRRHAPSESIQAHGRLMDRLAQRCRRAANSPTTTAGVRP